ncbi:MAG: ribose 5-phosphate isomerase B [Bacteroidota bacterium]
MPTNIAIGADHAGFQYKEAIKELLAKKGYHVIDKGAFSESSVDYPDFAHPVALAVENDEVDRGILVCGSGQGVCITANKHQGIRAALAWEPEIAKLSREHNNVNVLCLPARFISMEVAFQCIDLFLNTEFEGGRHGNRVNKIGC